jgi:hypothetical protein
MVPPELVDLISNLRKNARNRIGLWRMPLNLLGHESQIAVQADIDALDISQAYRNRLPAGAEFARLSGQRVSEILDEIASNPGKDCVLIYNLDLLISGISNDDCQNLWGSLLNGFPNRLRALVFAMPATATQLMPVDSVMEKWENAKRSI